MIKKYFRDFQEPPISARELNELQDNIEEAIDGVTLYMDDTIINMGATQLTLNDDLSNYKYYQVWASRFSNAPNWITTGKIPVGVGCFLSSAEATNYFRDIQCPTSGTIVTVSADNSEGERCVVRKIVGYK